MERRENGGRKEKEGRKGGRKEAREGERKEGRKKRSAAVSNQSPFPYKGSSNRGNFG